MYVELSPLLPYKFIHLFVCALVCFWFGLFMFFGLLLLLVLLFWSLGGEEG